MIPLYFGLAAGCISIYSRHLKFLPIIIIVALIITFFTRPGHPVMNQDDVPDFVQITNISGVHRSGLIRHGAVVTLELHNKNASLTTPANVNGNAPMWIGCFVSTNGGKSRPVAMAMDWILDPATNDVGFRQLKPGETRLVDFSTKLDFDFMPVDAGTKIEKCFLGGNKFQAMFQVGINMADAHRGDR